MLVAVLWGYFGEVISCCRNHCRTVLRDRGMRQAISHIDSFSRRYICLILANLPTVIIPSLPARFLSR
jgi:hypothetical protein